MANILTAMNGTDPSDGDILDAADWTGTLDPMVSLGKVHVIYTGSGFDTTSSGTSTDNDDHELDAVTAANIIGMNYAQITITMDAEGGPSGAGAYSRAKLQVQIKDIGGSYSDILAETTFLQGDQNGGDDKPVYTIILTHTLTADEKSAGFQVKILTESECTAAGSAHVTNIMTTVQTFS